MNSKEMTKIMNELVPWRGVLRIADRNITETQRRNLEKLFVGNVEILELKDIPKTKKERWEELMRKFDDLKRATK